MRISSPRLRRLDDALYALSQDSDAMLISELDGYLAGIITCPDLVDPAEWLPPVWSEEGAPAPFEDAREAQWYNDLVVEHRDALIRTLDGAAARYAPFLEFDNSRDEVMWELWIEGFELAMGLRPDSWITIPASGDAAAATALDGLIMLADIARDASDLDRTTIDRLTHDAPDLIRGWIPILYRWTMAHRPIAVDAGVAAPAAKVGRNDPCPCGSGRKYKKCCALGQS